MQTRFQSFLDSNNLTPTTQSAYRQFYSTEMAVTKMYNDLLLAADSDSVCTMFAGLDGCV